MSSHRAVPRSLRLQFHLRPARPDDAAGIAEVHIRSWQAAYAGLIPDAYLDGLAQGLAQRSAHWREALQNQAVEAWVAEAGGEVVGWIAFRASRDADAQAGDGEVQALYLLPAFWAQGIGQSLWLLARQQLLRAGYQRATLWVLAQNARAIGFYQALGFQAQAHSLRPLQRGGRTLEEVRYHLRLRP